MKPPLVLMLVRSLTRTVVCAPLASSCTTKELSVRLTTAPRSLAFCPEATEAREPDAPEVLSCASAAGASASASAQAPTKVRSVAVDLILISPSCVEKKVRFHCDLET